MKTVITDIKNFVKLVKADLASALTPAEKEAIISDAKELIVDAFDAIGQALITSILSSLENKISK